MSGSGAASGSNVHAARRSVDYESILGEQLANLAPEAFPVSDWTIPNITKSFLTVPKFIDTIKVLTACGDPVLIRRIAAQAITRQAWESNTTCTIPQMFKFCTWLRTPQGTELINDLRRTRNLEKKTVGEQSIEDVGYVGALEQMLTDRALEIKLTRADYDNRLAEARRQIVLLEMEKESKLKRIDELFQPASFYVPLDDMDLGMQCYELYQKECAALGKDEAPFDEHLMEDVRATYQNQALAKHKAEFVRDEDRRNAIKYWVEKKILELDGRGDRRLAQTFPPTLLHKVGDWMMKFELPLRHDLVRKMVLGHPQRDLRRRGNFSVTLREFPPTVGERRTRGFRWNPPLSKLSERTPGVTGTLQGNARLHVVVPPRAGEGGSIPTARSKFESKVRKVIGGGEMRGWREDTAKYRGGGNFCDAIKLLADASVKVPGRTLRDCYTVDTARLVLKLPCGLGVPRGPESVIMKNFNNEATAGPCMRAFGIRRKYGLKRGMEEFAWSCLDAYALGGRLERSLPYVAARVGFRTKLLEQKEAMRKIADGKPLGRAVMMLDTHEQVFSSALYNVLSGLTNRARHTRESGFRNTTIRASSDWAILWEEVRDASAVVELDWKKFDRERPADDIQFMIEVICSCFEPKDVYEERLLEAHRIMLNRSLIERPLITDDGGVFTIEGMVPSGSLWTGWLDTALNILYITAVLRFLNFDYNDAVPKCAGDDNLTLFYTDVNDAVLNRIKVLLNEWFLAGIEDEEFLIHRPPFHVGRVQAVFPPGTDLSQGTSKMLDQAEWIPIEEEMIIDEPAGLSHRWKYTFDGKPKFLSCYWDRFGNPIRPSYINLEKLLWPEGIHATIDDYEAAVISMVVDNPFNHHNVNHMMHRYCIIQQVKRIAVTGIKPEDVLTLCKFKGGEDEPVVFPMVAEWRRVDGWVDMEKLPNIKGYVDQFKSFVQGVSSLYTRSPRGGLDAWRFMDIIRGFDHLAEGQFGNDLDDWVSFLKNHPVSRYLKPTRGNREVEQAKEMSLETQQRFNRFRMALHPLRTSNFFDSMESYARWISESLRNRGSM
uniref:Fusion protein n=1 Tax=Rubber dandelion latent virus 1 TaxID=2175279 RepID=A0A2S1PH03_9VIRU|nr:fusion protein [Rubber dandelion latent virus 1]